MTVIGIDLGTSALKAVLVDAAEAVLAEAVQPIATQAPRSGWSEQHPADWWLALSAALGRLRAADPSAYADVRGIGLSGQMHGAVPLDADGAPLRPAILWNDSRSIAESRALTEAVPDIERIAGIGAMPGFTAPKLLWIRRHQPEIFRRIAKVLSPKDYLRLRLTGEAATDLSDAAGTLWLDQGARDWSDALLSACGLGRPQMPSLMAGDAAGGPLLAGTASELDLSGAVLVAGGAGDAVAGGLGIGAVSEGDAFLSLGTSAQFFVMDGRYNPQPGTSIHAFAHTLPGRWYRMAAMLNGASCLDFIARLLGEADIGDLLSRTEAAYRGPSRAIFLPYLSGERTPHNDPFARGVFAGLDSDCGATELTQAVLEGVAFSLLEARLLLDAAGVEVGEAAIVGGGAQSRFWTQLIADVVGLPLTRYRGGARGPAFGAARLAHMALTGEAAASACRRPPVLDRLIPDKARTEDYAGRFERYRRLYRALAQEFPQSAEAATAVP